MHEIAPVLTGAVAARSPRPSSTSARPATSAGELERLRPHLRPADRDDAARLLGCPAADRDAQLDELATKARGAGGEREAAPLLPRLAVQRVRYTVRGLCAEGSFSTI
jgi:hypothetical protein